MNEGNKWLWTLTQGIIAMLIGLVLLFAGQLVNTALAWAFGAFLLVTGAIQLWKGAFRRRAPGGTIDLLIGLIGVLGGGATILLLWLTQTPIATIYTILTIGFIAYGVVGLFETLFARGQDRFRWLNLLMYILVLALGILIFISRSQDISLIVWAGVILTAVGAIMAGYAFFVQRPKPRAVATPAPAPTPAPSTPTDTPPTESRDEPPAA